MPRTRQQPQQHFANRTDLVAPTSAGSAPPPPQPMAVAKGQPYGEAGAQSAALHALPLPDARAQQQNEIANTVGQATAPMAPGPYDGSQLQAEAQAWNPSIIGIGAPSQRPNEHVLSGAPVGPGPGPEALGPTVTADTVQSYLGRMGSIPGASSEVQMLRAMNPQAGMA